MAKTTIPNKQTGDTLSAAEINDVAVSINTLYDTVGAITKTTVGLGNVDNTSDVSKPVSTAQATAISNAIASLTKNSVGLSNVDNTSDINKPVSTAQSAAITAALNNISTITTRDVSFEVVTLGSTNIYNMTYNPLRPNKNLTLTGNLTLSVLNTNDGDSGLIQFYRSVGGEVLIFNGISNVGTLPTTQGLRFLVSYINVGGNVIWSV